MNIRALRVFRLVASLGSLAAAAETMNMSAPAASRLIALLEAEIRLQLFHRSRRRLQLTPQGQAFYREAEHILAGFDEIPRIADAIRTEAKGRLRIVTAPRIGLGIVSPALALFCRENPGIHASVDEQSRFGIEAQMGTRLYDLGIISLPVSHPFVEIENHPLFQVRMEAVLPKGHRLASNRRSRLPTWLPSDCSACGPVNSGVSRWTISCAPAGPAPSTPSRPGRH